MILPWLMIITGSFTLTVTVIVGLRAAYRNGVADGYGFARDPDCPGYAKAGEYLKKAMSHQWSEIGKRSVPTDMLRMCDEFDEYSKIPVNPANVCGLQVSRMHFEGWRDRIRKCDWRLG